MVCVDFKVDEYLSDASDRALKYEVEQRELAIGPQPWTRRGMADDIRNAFYCRNASRLEMLLAELEMREFA